MLARDAAEILWEMVAMGEGGAAVQDMKNKGEQLQAQLRGLISDYQVRRARLHQQPIDRGCPLVGVWG